MDIQGIAIIGCVWFCICLLIGHCGENNLVDRIGAAIAIFFAVPVIIGLLLIAMFFIFLMFKTALGL